VSEFMAKASNQRTLRAKLKDETRKVFGRSCAVMVGLGESG
jgi:hypothetical protein